MRPQAFEKNSKNYLEFCTQRLYYYYFLYTAPLLLFFRDNLTGFPKSQIYIFYVSEIIWMVYRYRK